MQTSANGMTGPTTISIELPQMDGLKRGLNGVYHKASKKHLHRYVDEFAFRLNAGKVTRHTLERLDSFIDCVTGKRITYAELTQ